MNMYLKGMPESKKIKTKICSCKNSEELLAILNDYKNYIKEKDL